MKVLTLTSTLVAALAITAFGQGNSTLLSQISLKEKQLVEIQKELSELRGKLNQPSTSGYIVKTGDTVHSIARRFSVSASDIQKWNNITDPTKLGIGDQLVVSASATQAATPKKTSSAGYVVAQGDTFYSIARRHKMTLAQLRTMNPDVSTHLIAPGQTLNVSGKVAPAKTQTAAKKPVVVVKKTSKPAPAPVVSTSKKTTTPKETVAKSTPPKRSSSDTQTVSMKATQKPISTPPAPPVVEEPEARSSASAIILTEVITFDAFANKHNTSTDQLNALNGWNLPKSTVLARGSEIIVPK